MARSRASRRARRRAVRQRRFWSRPPSRRSMASSAGVEIVAQAHDDRRAPAPSKGGSEGRGMMSVVGYDMSEGSGAASLRSRSGIGPDDIQAVELHDCFTPERVDLLRSAGALTPEGTAERYIRDGQNTYGGKHVTNPSGGLLSKGPSARRDRPRAMLRTDAPATRHRRQASGRGYHGTPSSTMSGSAALAS